MSKNKNKSHHAAAAEAAPFEVNEDGSPAGSAFGEEGTEAQGHEGTEGVLKPGPDGDAETAASESGKLAAPSVNNGGGAAGDDADAKATPPPAPKSRRNQICERIAHIERDGGPIGRTQRVNENWKELRAERDRQLAEWDKEIAELRGQVTAMEKLQQAELEEARVLKIELAKMAD